METDQGIPGIKIWVYTAHWEEIINIMEAWEDQGMHRKNLKIISHQMSSTNERTSVTILYKVEK